jgi:hypothetical protein
MLHWVQGGLKVPANGTVRIRLVITGLELAQTVFLYQVEVGSKGLHGRGGSLRRL